MTVRSVLAGIAGLVSLNCLSSASVRLDVAPPWALRNGRLGSSASSASLRGAPARDTSPSRMGDDCECANPTRRIVHTM